MPGSRCNETHLPLRLSANRRFLVGANETPFFWMGDTAWGLLNLLDKPDTELYLRTRARQGFNVVQCVVLTPEDGFGEEP
ncbi:MAG: DUF4038 domain-containing protein, partial [Lentisphaeria bacterium]|nr:DUF4038 domain-containing protein [Lentisphaeria bacterium]